MTGKIYRGRHSTTNVDDGYLGSGNAILAAIKKYGRENFTRAILEFLPTLEELEARERELVNEEFVARGDTYNQIIGGRGSAPKTDDQRGAISIGVKLKWQDPDYQASQRSIEKSRKVSEAQQRSWKSGTRKKMERKGSHSKGKSWVTKDGQSIMVPREELQQYEMQGYSRGRIIKG